MAQAQAQAPQFSYKVHIGKAKLGSIKQEGTDYHYTFLQGENVNDNTFKNWLGHNKDSAIGTMNIQIQKKYDISIVEVMYGGANKKCILAYAVQC